MTEAAAQHRFALVDECSAKYEWMSFDLTTGGNKISTLHVDPWLFSLGVGYRF